MCIVAKKTPYQEHDRPESVTIMQIAARLQLSHTTVSRVLNKPHASVSEDARQRVTTLAREMGYRPNLAARSLRDARTNLVGIFTSPQAGLWGGITNVTFSALTSVFHPRGLHVFLDLSSSTRPDHETLPAWRFDGAILLRRPSDAMTNHLLKVERPFVAIEEMVEGGVSVLTDSVGGVRQAMDHLFDLGHRSITFAAPSPSRSCPGDVTDRISAHCSYLEERGISPVIERGGDRVDWLRHSVLRAGATAILVYDNIVLLEVLAAARQLSLRIPTDISLVCLQDDLLTSKLNPPITAVAQQAATMGRKAGELLLARIEARQGALPPEDADCPAVLRIPETLIVRGSTGPAPGRN